MAEHRISWLMITHNIHSALDLGNRTIMMSAGRIVLDVADEQRAGLTMEDLLALFREKTAQKLDNDRILLG